MPPKKPAKEEKILLGRPGNNLKSGIVSLPFLRQGFQMLLLLCSVDFECYICSIRFGLDLVSLQYFKHSLLIF